MTRVETKFRVTTLGHVSAGSRVGHGPVKSRSRSQDAALPWNMKMGGGERGWEQNAGQEQGSMTNGQRTVTCHGHRTVTCHGHMTVICHGHRIGTCHGHKTVTCHGVRIHETGRGGRRFGFAEESSGNSDGDQERARVCGCERA